jgi:thiamine kinase-like enzyme
LNLEPQLPFYANKNDNAVLSIVTFLNPSSFLEAARLWNFILPDQKPIQEETLTLARSLDEIKKMGADIFAKNDSYLTARIVRMNGGLTNACFKLQTNKGFYFLRVPGKGSEEHLSREDEAYNIKIAHSLGFNIEIFFFNSQTGLYVGEFIHDPQPLTLDRLQQEQTMIDVAMILKTLHINPRLFRNTIDIFTRLKILIQKINSHSHTMLKDQTILFDRINTLYQVCSQDNSPLVACHNDPTYLNFLYQQKRLRLLDWEYSGNNKAMFDLANFAVTSSLSLQCESQLLKAYYDKDPDQQLLEIFEAYKHTTHIWYYLWAELQIANQSNIVPTQELKELAESHWEAMTQNPIIAPDHTKALFFL